MQGTQEAGGTMRVGAGRRALAVLAVATATACGAPFQDLGPLPERYAGPPLPADRAVADLTEAMAEAGVAVRRAPREASPIECHEVLTAEPPAAGADAALRAGFARARSGHGWQDAPRPTERTLSLRKADWTATTQLIGSTAAGQATSPVVITLLCDAAHSKAGAPTPPPTPTP
ncbi:hypothetical protein WDV06_11140 [Streptomyces racemochromogenes]|uniref:Lipoprotein n=1 Tax=Streptomyces racemochromogenes TaxID=67353 RepID=A0ABW7PBA6_9ACTN